MWFACTVQLDRRPHVLVLIAIGLAGGILSGAFGVGGGIVLVPLLVNFGGLDQRRAAATSLLAILPTSIAGSITYLAHGEVDLLAAGVIAVGAITGSVIGSALLKRLPLVWLRWMFIALLVIVAVRLALIEPVRGEPLEFSVPVALAYVAIGLVMGIASGLFGIGGGVIAVPSLVAVLGISDLIAKGTSLLVMIPTSITGTITNTRARLVDLRTALIVGVAAAAASVLGAFIALAMPPRPSTLLFAALLLVIAVQLAVRALRARKQ
ncbi:MAG: Permease [Rhodoglobus sp.]|nr:Permease [Rhodoglobus sp.]